MGEQNKANFLIEERIEEVSRVSRLEAQVESIKEDVADVS